MDYNYLVPANSKKQGLFLGFLSSFDLILLSIGVSISFLLLLILNISSFLGITIAVLPGFISAFLVFPIPNYHNSRIFFREMYRFYFVNRRKYVWRGWCYKYEQSDE